MLAMENPTDLVRLLLCDGKARSFPSIWARLLSGLATPEELHALYRSECRQRGLSVSEDNQVAFRKGAKRYARIALRELVRRKEVVVVKDSSRFYQATPKLRPVTPPYWWKGPKPKKRTTQADAIQAAAPSLEWEREWTWADNILYEKMSRSRRRGIEQCEKS